MELLDFLTSEVVSLPKKRGNDSPFDVFLSDIFANYMEAVNQLSDADPVASGVKKSRPIIQAVSKKLGKAVQEYLRGFPHAAYKYVKAGITKLGTAFNCLELGSGYSASMREFERLYRVRIGKLERFSRGTCFTCLSSRAIKSLLSDIASPVCHPCTWEVRCGSAGRRCKDRTSTRFSSPGSATPNPLRCSTLAFVPW